MFAGFTEQELVNDFKLHFPLVAEHAVKCRLKKYGLLEVILDDNSKLVFDYVNKSIFNIKDNLDDISETDWRKHFRYKLIMILYKVGMSQKRLAEKTGISEVTICKYTNGSATPSLYNARKIARALDIDINELVDI